MNRLTKPIGSYINLTTGLDKSPHIINLLIYLTINSLICLLLAYPFFREKDKNKLSSLPTLQKIKIHLSLNSFSFSLHLTLVNSRKNKNREMMTPPPHSYIHVYIIYFIQPLVSSSHLSSSFIIKKFFSLSLFSFSLHFILVNSCKNKNKEMIKYSQLFAPIPKDYPINKIKGQLYMDNIYN